MESGTESRRDFVVIYGQFDGRSDREESFRRREIACGSRERVPCQQHGANTAELLLVLEDDSGHQEAVREEAGGEEGTIGNPF